MKKLLCLLLSLCIGFSACTLGAVAAADTVSVSGGSTGVSAEISAEEFADDVSQLIEQNKNLPYYYAEESDDGFETARLIVKSAHNIDTRNAISVASGYGDLWVLQYETPGEAKSAYSYYNGRPGIQFVEPDKKVQLCSASVDKLSTAAVNFDNISWGTANSGMLTLKYELKPNLDSYKTVSIAVVDTGVNANHEYLEGRVEPTKINTSSSGTRNSSDDDNGHGTQVASVIADATLSNIIIKPYKVLDKHGTGTFASVAAGINCAVNDGVDVINVSIGFYEHSETLKAAVDNAYEKEIIVVSSAGNDRTDAPSYPSSYPNVIRVAATNQNNVVANFSNYGEIDIGAPGVSVMVANYKSGYQTASGTSLASPLVASVAAVIMSIIPDASPEDIINIIKNNALESFEPNSELYLGAGILRVPTLYQITNREKTAAPTFSHAPVIYQSEFELTISCATPNSVIYYTTDETVPSKDNPSAKIYTDPILITKTTKLLAVAYSEDKFRSRISDFSTIVAPLAADNEFEIDADGKILSYSGSAQSITVPDEINGITVTAIGDRVFKNKGLKEIILPKTVTSVGIESFAENPDMKTAIAHGLSSIGDRAFYNCIWLKNIFFDEIKEIGEYSFYNVCIKAFEIRESTFSLDIRNLADIPEGAFKNSGISEANIDVRVTIGEDAFEGCNGLVNLNLDHLDSINDGAFKDLLSLKEVTIKKLENVPKGLFNSCIKLEHLHLPDVKYVDSNAFENCASLELVELPLAETVYSNAFNGCDSLYYLVLESAKGFEPEAYKSPNAPPLPKNLLVFLAPKFEKTVPLMFADCPYLLIATFEGATEIASRTFYGCKNIIYLDIQNVKYIGANTFENCNAVAIDARSMISTKSLPNDSGIILSNEFVESEMTAENLTVYGTPGTYIERYSNYKGYTFVGIPVILQNVPEYVTEDSEMVSINVIGFDLTYQWYWNGKKSTEGGTPIKGANGRSYIFTHEDTAPYYYCEITHHDIDRDVVIYTDIITKDSTPADYTEYNKAVEAANAIDKSIYVNAEILDEALAVDVSGKYSCEQDIVDAQTKAIYDAIAALNHNGAKELIINISDTNIRLFDVEKLTYFISPTDANCSEIKWSSEQNGKDILIYKNGRVRSIDTGEAVIKGEITNPDGEIIQATITVRCTSSIISSFFAKFFRPLWLLHYKYSALKI